MIELPVLLLVAGALTVSFIFAIRVKWGLLPLGVVDVLIGLLLVGAQAMQVVHVASFSFPGKIVFVLGVLLVGKGVYSILFSLK